MANVYLALENNLEIIPVLNKIDLPHADPEKVKEEIEDILGIDAENADQISAKTGVGIGPLLETIVKKVPPPAGKPNENLQALIFDSWFDSYRGVVILIRVVNGSLKKKDKIFLKHSGSEYENFRYLVLTYLFLLKLINYL